MKATEIEQLKTVFSTIMKAVPKRIRLEVKDDVYLASSLLGIDEDLVNYHLRGKHWQVKKQLEVYCLEWRSTGEQVILTQDDMAKYLKITPRQVAYRCSAAGGKYSETKYNPEIGNDDIMTLTKFMLQPGETL